MKKTVIYIFIILACTSLLLYPEVAGNAVTESLKKTVSQILPSIFPFMVLSDIIVYIMGNAKTLSLLNPISKFLNLPCQSLPIIILGNISGFPVGAKNAAKLKRMGTLSDKEALRVAIASNNVSPSFVLSFVGTALYSSRKLGLLLYFSQLSSAFLISTLLSVVAKRKSKTNLSVRLPHENSVGSELTAVNSPISIEEAFVSAVSDAALSSVTVTAFISVFAVIIEYASILLEKIDADPIWRAIVSSFLEISNGCMESTSAPLPVSYIICSFAIGFSGMSVMFQSFLFLSKEGINTKSFVGLKLLQGILSALITFFSVKTVPNIAEVSLVAVNENAVYSALSYAVVAIIGIYLLVKIKKTFVKFVSKREKS